MVVPEAVANEIDILGRISGERARSLSAELSRIEHRAPGSESERRAAETIADEMRKLGIDVSLEEFPALSWEHSESRLRLSNGSQKVIDSELMPYSPPVPEGGAKGRLVPLRFGFAREFDALGDEPSVVLLDWNEDTCSHLPIFTAARSGRRIAALGFVSHLPGAYRIDAVPMPTKPIPFPVFALKKEDGEMLRGLCEREAPHALLEGESRIVHDAVSANVIGRKRGKEEPNLRVLVSAHHDGWFAGANDNLSSVACMLEVARALQDLDLRRGMEFISFGSEEGGKEGYQYYLWGSRQYLKRHSDETGSIACLINSEFAGNSNSANLLVDCTPDLLSFYELVCEEISGRPVVQRHGVELGVAYPPNSQADQLPFSWSGVSSSIIYWSWFDEYHTDLDVADRLSGEKMQMFSELMTLSALRAAHSAILPHSLTRYARAIRTGHAAVTSYLSCDVKRVSIPGLDQLERFAVVGLDFSSFSAALDEFSIASSDFERLLTSGEPGRMDAKNGTMLMAAQMLNRALCRVGGLLGEEPMFPGYLQYIEVLRKIENAIESVSRVDGADIDSETKREFGPMFPPEIDVKEFDLSGELAELTEKRDRLRGLLQKEIGRVASSLSEAASVLRDAR